MPQKKPPQPPPFHYKDPDEKRNWPALIGAAAFIAFGVAAIVWLVMIASPERKLTCRASAGGQWNAMGRCTEE